MNRRQRHIYYDTDLQIEMYEFKGIGQKFVSHFHGNYVIGLMEKGSRNFVCGGRKYVIAAGDILLINPRQAHGCEQIGGENLHYFSFNIAEEIMQEIAGYNVLPYFAECVVKSQPLKRLMLDLRELIATGGDSSAKGKLFLLMMKELLKYCSGEALETEQYKTAAKIEDICQYLTENYWRNVTLDELVQMSGISKFHLIRLFVRQKKLSPHKYLETVRIEQAKHFLEEGFSPVQAALKAGFTDQSHFTNVFRALIGLTPRVYKNIMKEVDK